MTRSREGFHVPRDAALDGDLRTRVVAAVRWTFLSKFTGQLVSWAVTLYVIRLLSPDDYGAMAMAGVPIAFFYLVNTVGLDAVLVQKRDLSPRRRAQVFGVVITLNLLFFLGFLSAAPWIAAFYREPALTSIIRALAVQFVFHIFETLPQAQLERDLHFGPRSIVEVLTLVTGSLTTLVLAHAGFGVWALILGSLTTTAVRMLGLNVVQPSLCWPVFSLKGMREDLTFGRAATVDRIIRFTFADTDRLIGGRIFGDKLLGYYAVANDLASLPLSKLTGLINSIALPAFSKTALQTESPGGSLLTVCRLMSLFVFPFFLGLSSVAPELIALLLGAKWQPVAVPLEILSIVMPLRMLMNMFQPFLWGIGSPGGSISTFLIGGLTMPLGFLVGAQWGPVGLGMAWLVLYPWVFLLSVAHVGRLAGVRVAAILGSIRSPACAGVLMWAVVVTAKSFLAHGQGSEVVRLVELVVIGAAVYVGCMLVLNQTAIREAMRLVGAFIVRSRPTRTIAEVPGPGNVPTERDALVPESGFPVEERVPRPSSR